MPIELLFKTMLFSIVCGIIGYILFVLIMFSIALFQIGAWVFVLTSGGMPGG